LPSHLTPSDHELIVVESDFELFAREAGDRQGDPKPLGTVVCPCKALDIVGRVTIRSGFGDPIKRPLDLVEAQEIGRRQGRRTGHSKPFAALRPGPGIGIPEVQSVSFDMGSVDSMFKRSGPAPGPALPKRRARGSMTARQPPGS
jgi:hypothetical protein